jgi:acetolactate synthase-1/2/3 large subunit
MTIIYDNQGYAAMKHHPRYYPEGYSVKTEKFYGVHCLPKPDYVKLAEAFGGYGIEIRDPSEITRSIIDAFSELKNGRFALLDVILPGC